ncbi:MAG: hypothetical protein ACOC8L_05250, partial [Spirochaetota bacterium]
MSCPVELPESVKDLNVVESRIQVVDLFIVNGQRHCGDLPVGPGSCTRQQASTHQGASKRTTLFCNRPSATSNLLESA